MKGLFVIGKNELRIMDLPKPVPGPFEALVKTENCAICNSTDTKLMDGEFFSGTFPMLLGHESVGRIVALGEKVKHFKIGDRVLRGALEDRHIPYSGGRSCWGGFVEYNLVTDVWSRDGGDTISQNHPQQIVPLSISALDAAALITLKENLSFIKNLDVEGKTVAIIGTGPVAQTMALFSRLKGARFTACFARNDKMKPIFTRVGVDEFVIGKEMPKTVEKILKSGGFDRAAEAVGSHEAIKLCLELTGNLGKTGLYGIAPESAPYQSADEKQPNVFRPRVAESEVHTEMLDLIRQGKVNLADWHSHAMDWSEYQKGFELVWSKTASKVVLNFA